MKKFLFALATVLALSGIASAAAPPAHCPDGKCQLAKRVPVVSVAAPVKSASCQSCTACVKAQKTGWHPGKLLGRVRGCR